MSTGDVERIHEELVELLEGQLDPAAAKRVEGQIAASEAYRREYETLQAVYTDLEAMGRAFAAKVPPIDVKDTVMTAVAKAAHPQKIASLDAQRARQRERRRLWLGLAVAAALLLALGYGLFRTAMLTTTPGGPQAPPVAKNQETPETGPGPEMAPEDVQLAKERKEFIRAWRQLQKNVAQTPDMPKDMETTAPPSLNAPTMEDILAARREGGGDRSGIAKLMQWATLKKEQARKIAEDPNASPQAVVGAAESLSGTDAAQMLLTVVGHLPDDPHAQFEVAKAFSEAPDEQDQTQALDALPRLHTLDPDNALPYYLEAKLRFEQGDIQGALDALAIAKKLPTASAYSLESALSKAQALIANGLPQDEARLVSALTAGMDQYNFLCDLGKNLIEYGQEFMDQRQYDTAQQIFESVQSLGQQVEGGATFSREQLAGLDLQASAVDVLEQLYTAIESPEGISQLTVQTQDLVQSIEQLGGFFDKLDQLFSSESGTDFFNQVSGLILEYGDRYLFDYLREMGISIDSSQ